MRPESMVLRPLTQESGHCYRSQTPLSVIKTRSKALSNDSSPIEEYSSIRRKKFLRRGEAIDKAIIQNVLKSKLNKNVCAPTFSYADEPQNKELLEVISKQIPKGVRDVVGVEEMMRMSHIFTGVQFKNSSLTKRLNATLTLAKNNRKPTNSAE